MIYLAFLIMLAQGGSLVSCVVKNTMPFDTHYGFSVWGVVPVLLILMADNTIRNW